MCGVVCVADYPADPPARGDLLAVRVCPFALREFVRVPALGRAAAAGPAGPTAHLASGGNVVGERFAECVGVVIGQVDLVVAAVETEGDGATLAFVDGGRVCDPVEMRYRLMNDYSANWPVWRDDGGAPDGEPQLPAWLQCAVGRWAGLGAQSQSC